MKMKKIGLTIAMATLTLAASAQSLNVNSAVGNLRKGYLNKAKAEIDAACLHEDTKEDPHTWQIKATVYARIGEESKQKKSKYKDLAPDWAEQTYNALVECKRLDTKQEYAKEVNQLFGVVGQDYFNRCLAAHDAQDFRTAMELGEKSSDCFTSAGMGQFANQSLYYAGLGAYGLKDTANVKKYFNALSRKRTDYNFVYTTLFAYSKAENNPAEAMKVANLYVKNCKNDYRAYILSAQGYFLNNNLEKGKEMISQALNMTKDSANLYPVVLVAAAGMLDENAQDYEGAEAKYKESLTLEPNQFGANMGMGRMYFNRGVDKNNAANAIDPFDEEKAGLYEKLSAESKELFGQSIAYLEKAVAYIDGLETVQAKESQRVNLINALMALETAYVRVDMQDKSNEAKARREQLMK
jgi:hypothetical protein